MRLTTVLAFIICLIFAATVSAADLQLHSVKPATTNSAATVQIYGNGFSTATKVLLGGAEFTPVLIDATQLQLRVPQLDEGEYALQLIDQDRMAVQNLSLRIELPPPQIDSVSPANIDECSTPDERHVTVRGRYFQPDSTLLVNDAERKATVVNDQQINFVAPALDAGSYGVMIGSAAGKFSLPQSLYINNVPKIFNLSVGEDYVNSYQLIITGKNFYPDSRLVISDNSTPVNDLPSPERVVASRAKQTFPRSVPGDYLNYVDCTTLIYVRYPYSRQERELSLQIVNPDGKSSSPAAISTP